jgi:hypothetical protein
MINTDGMSDDFLKDYLTKIKFIDSRIINLKLNC